MHPFLGSYMLFLSKNKVINQNLWMVLHYLCVSLPQIVRRINKQHNNLRL